MDNKRLKLSSEEIKEQNNTTLNINHLPAEVLENIFKYLNIRDLCQATRVCKRWHEISNNPNFWRKVQVHFNSSELDETSEVVIKFVDMLLPHVTHLKLTFDSYLCWSLDLTDFFRILQLRCPLLQALIFHSASIKVTDDSLLIVAAKLLPNIKVLVMHESLLTSRNWLDIIHNFSEIEVLDLSTCFCMFNNFIFKVPPLKELRLADTYFADFLSYSYAFSNLRVLDLEGNRGGSFHFLNIQNYLFHLTELYMCFTGIEDEDIIFKNPVDGLKCLKIICLRGCYVTFEGINSLIQSCSLLQHVYVSSLHYAIQYTKCDPEKVKVNNILEMCHHYSKMDYMQD